MKIGKAPEILKKAAAMVRSKTSVLGARLLVLASLRRRMATVGAISHRIHALVAAADRPEKARVDCDKALVLSKAMAMGDKRSVHGEIVDLSELALFDQEGDHYGGCPDWTHSLFNDDDDCCYTDEDEDGGDADNDDHGVLLDAYDDDDDDDEEPSVMDVIRSNREDEGLEFNMDDEIDQAADMFIWRFRSRMNRSASTSDLVHL